MEKKEKKVISNEMSILLGRINEERENEKIRKVKNIIKKMQDHSEFCAVQMKKWNEEEKRTTDKLVELLTMSIDEIYEKEIKENGIYLPQTYAENTFSSEYAENTFSSDTKRSWV